ncbi:MAG: DUF5916 domain-containing protein [Ferruginibacter sp.]
MNKKLWVVLYIFLIAHAAALAQQAPQRSLQAMRTNSPIKIDGIPDEAIWKTAPVAEKFIEFRPNAGAVENPSNATQVYILYDNSAIYIAGYCHELNADSISRELVGRDKVGSNDFVGVIFDTYYDKINATGFYVTASSEQYDAKYSNSGNEDDTWNAVWDSKSVMQKDGWTFEMRIPYSALRFSPKNSTWGLNITRKRNKSGQQFMWNSVVPTINGFINQEGTWDGITDIKPPLRLAFSPYLSAYINNYPNKTNQSNFTQSINGGMDVKYGINQNYTLDMTLIPDFGQVQSDKQVLNLSPFEVRYNENRDFFTEGTELFNKGNLFYSRRIGSQPIHKYDVQTGTNEVVSDNPSESKLLNATKISGRNKKGLGIGLLNAITKPMYAEVLDTATGKTRDVKTNPLTNYNILVLDKTLKNNSSVSFVNTNVLREGSDYDANVSAFVFDMYNKKNVYNWYGQTSLSNKTALGKNETGYSHNLGFAKTGGRFNFNLVEELANTRYDKNDLGILYNNNYVDHSLWIGYKWVKPKSFYNRINLNINNNLSHRFEDGSYQSYNANINMNGQLKNLWSAGLSMVHNEPGNDYYEPRKEGKVFRTSRSTGAGFWVNSNEAKKYYWGASINGNFREMFTSRSYNFDMEQRYRFSSKFSMSQGVSYNPVRNAAGFAAIDGSGNVIFNRRNRETVENSLSIKYNFNNKSGINLQARHYWSGVKSLQYYALNNDGSLDPNTTYTNNRDYNLNLFNVDMVYTWQFATGSFMYIVWKNNIVNDKRDDGYIKNLRQTLSATQNNNLSIKILYYLDYLKFKKH